MRIRVGIPVSGKMLRYRHDLLGFQTSGILQGAVAYLVFFLPERADTDNRIFRVDVNIRDGSEVYMNAHRAALSADGLPDAVYQIRVANST